MPRRAEISVRDFLIIWNLAAKGVKVAPQIERYFDEENEREIGKDSIRKWVGKYDEFKRLLPQYPELCKELARIVTPASVLDISSLPGYKEHFNDIRHLINEWRTQIRVPEAEYALPKDITSTGSFGPPGIHKGSHPTDDSVDSPLVVDGVIKPVWKVNEDRSVELYCPIEDELLFIKSIPYHLPSLYDKFNQWKKRGSEYLRLCFSLYENISKEIERKVDLPGLSEGSDEHRSGIMAPDFPEVIYKDAIWNNKGYVYFIDKDMRIHLFKESWTKEGRPSLPFTIPDSNFGLCELRLAKMVVARGSAMQMVECKNIYESMMLRYRGNEQVTSLIDFEADLKKLTEELDREMREAILKETFPNRCDLCPTKENTSSQVQTELRDTIPPK
jgi:hypothetical protein